MLSFGETKMKGKGNFTSIVGLTSLYGLFWEVKMTTKSLIMLFVATGVLLSTVQCNAGTFTAFGPRNFVRGNGKPVTETASLTIKNADISYTLKVYNGGINSGYPKVSSAVIKLNGSTVLEEKDFNQQISNLSKSISLGTSNQLQVELRSAPGSGLTVIIEGEDNTSPDVIVDFPSNGSYTNNPSTMVRGTATDSISWINAVTVNSANAILTGESFSSSLSLSEGTNCWRRSKSAKSGGGGPHWS
jgi:hypothetical protein